MILILSVLVTACGGSTSEPRAGEPDSPGKATPVGKYKQTWAKDYSTTLCTDWLNVMDDHQRFVMAADMLFGAQQADKPDVGLPPDGQVETLSKAIGSVCDEGAKLGIKVTETAASLYMMADDLKPQ